MKTSNALLLLTLATCMLFIAAIPILYNMDIPNRKKEHGPSQYLKRAFMPGRIIKVQDASDVTLFAYDSLIVESKGNDVSITEAGDTLKITRNGPVLMYVPRDHHVVAVNSKILLRGTYYRINAPDLTITMSGSELYSTPISQDVRVGNFFEHLTVIDRGNSRVDLKGILVIGRLTLKEVDNFSCSPDVGIGETDFVFDNKTKVWTRSCREGLYVDSK